MKSKKLGEIRFPYLDGFTLLELLIVISIAGILLSITIPSYSNLVSQKRVEAAANSFHSAVALAGSESRKRGKNVNIRPIGWAGNNALTLAEGWEVYYQESGTQVVMRQERPSGNLLVGGTGSKGFKYRGDSDGSPTNSQCGVTDGNIVTVDEDPWLTSNGSRRVLYSYLEID